MSVEFGIDTFGDVTDDPAGDRLSQAQVIRNVVAEGVLADQVGLEHIGIGEHHRDDFAISAPDMVLAAIAARTERLRLGTAVTVLSSDDPVRVHERFATLDAVSNGRAEITVGRGSFIESFPLFGYDLADYESLFEEKLAMFVELLKQEPVTWQGQHTQALAGVQLHPRIEHGPLPTWVAVGGSPESVVRAARYDLPMMLAIIGGPHERFAPFADLHRRALEQLGKAPQPVGFHSYGHIAETDELAREQVYRPWLEMTGRIGRERGWPRPDREQFLHEIEHGAMIVGSPETAARKIAAAVRALDAERVQLKVSTGTLPHERIMESIELYGTKVAPLVRDMLA
ncbi:LLM class flavin-dependent oxidoreductase [Brooklawnia cerclae]|uniref:LLM family oxidoreductase n=1 Tax=Brooklawnia cerclae TaxID=349934 RepID=A0ABX0SIQ8_9ACTN|nr:LLM class flavin-dependent oxidoreductase [Brooklawnia cerclae]NIH58224.1 putative LLM family oxidoreductase [Brooklawnia cerclae]